MVILSCLFTNCKQHRDEFKTLSSSEIAASEVFKRFCSIEEQRSNEAEKSDDFFPSPPNETALSPGDVIKILIKGDDLYTKNYILNGYGEILLPYLPPIKLSGLSLKTAQKTLKSVFEEYHIYQKNQLQISAHIVHLSPAKIIVSGAVFDPGQVVINNQDHTKAFKPPEETLGSYAQSRFLSTALKSAGGIKPNANINEIILIRNQTSYHINMSGVYRGENIEDPLLINGDQIIVPQHECYDARLVRPTAITAPGIRIYISNIIVNAPSITPEMMKIPYGTRLSHAMISANCVGGSRFLNSGRTVMLIRSSEDGSYAVLKRYIEHLIRSPNKTNPNPLITNPYLQPNDSIACYDSKITNIRELLSFVTELLLPFATINALTK